MLPKLYYISQGATPAEHSNNIFNALDAGVTLIQLRLKNLSQNTGAEFYHHILDTCRKYHAICIINDYYREALEYGAHGVHVGYEDEKPEIIRNYVNGKRFIIGATANNVSQLTERILQPIDYIGLGPLRFTSTKENLAQPHDFTGMKKLLNSIQGKCKVPVYAIGGIQLSDVETLLKIGFYGVAVSSDLTGADATLIRTKVKQYNKILYG